MSFLKNLLSNLMASSRKESHLYWVYVECGQCNEKLRIHVDLRNDLSIQYGETEKDDTYFARKRIIGSTGCFRPIDVELTFNKDRRLVDQQITGGRFINEDEYTAEDVNTQG